MHIIKKTFPWVLYSSIFIIALGTFWHFLYQIFGETSLIAWLAPVNESVWEHLKLALWPTLLIWLILSHCFTLPFQPDTRTIVLCSTISILTACICILSIYYIFEGGFGITNMAVHFGSYVIGIFAGQFISSVTILPNHFSKWVYAAGYILLILFILCTAFLSFHPANFPIFYDPTENLRMFGI